MPTENRSRKDHAVPPAATLTRMTREEMIDTLVARGGHERASLRKRSDARLAQLLGALPPSRDDQLRRLAELRGVIDRLQARLGPALEERVALWVALRSGEDPVPERVIAETSGVRGPSVHQAVEKRLQQG